MDDIKPTRPVGFNLKSISASRIRIQPYYLMEVTSSSRHHQGSGDPSGARPYRAKGPTLGKGKACEACRARRIRCNGAHPTCSNCAQADKDCVYLDKPRPPSSAAALSAKLASLEERYRILTQVEAARSSAARDPTAPAIAEEHTAANRALGSVPSLLIEDDDESDDDAAVPETAQDWLTSLGEARRSDLAPPPGPARIHPQRTPEHQIDALDDPYLESTMSKKDRKLMIDVYIRECYRYAVCMRPTRLFETLDSPNSKDRPHPCLLNAMILIALDFAATFPIEPMLDETGAHYIDFAVPASTPPPEVLLARTQAHCAQSLAEVDRLQDYIQASLLLSFWFFRQGRLMEGQYTMAANARLIINCKLHQIDYQVLQELAPGRTPPTLGHSKWDGTLLGRPKDAYELAHRIAIFWQSYYGDKTRSLMTGLPANYDETVDAHITTVWPRTLDEYISGTAFDVPYSSMDDLFDGSTPVGPLNTPFMMMFKGAALLDRAHRLTALERAPPERDIQALRDAIDTLNTSFDTLVTGTLLDHQGTPRSKSRNFCEANFRGLIMLYGLVAKIHVTYIRAFEEEEGAVEARFEERLAWASRCADVVVETTRELDAIAVGMNLGGKTPGVEHMCFMTGLLLTSASVVLVDQVHKLETAIAQIAPDTPARALLEAQLQEEEEKLDVIVGGIARVRETFPILDVLLERINRSRAD